tara:strand:+ start:40 stop:363 length:324 start_codon:yes stop_codon:yes gene_type:complete
MKSLVKNIRGYFNQRTKAIDAHKDASLEKRTLVIENGESAKKLLSNNDFALMFNLYRFQMLERLEECKDDKERIENATYVAGVRDFIDFIEKQEYLAKLVMKNLTKD